MHMSTDRHDRWAESAPSEPFLLASMTLARPAVLATSRQVQRMATAALGDEPAPLTDSLKAVKELLLPPEARDPEAPPGSRPPTRGNPEDEMLTPANQYKEAVENVKDDALPALAKLFDPQMGAAVTDPGLCKWLHILLTLF